VVLLHPALVRVVVQASALLDALIEAEVGHYLALIQRSAHTATLPPVEPARIAG
jgi:hypothetical protein